MSDRTKPKRGQNDGSIFQRSRDGKWVAAITLDNGKRKFYTAGTRAEAKAKLAEGMKGLDKGVDLKAGSLSVGKFLDKWLAAAKPTVKPRTHQGYESIVRVRVFDEIKKKPLNKLTPLDLQTLYADLEAKGLSARSIHHTHRCLHRAFAQALRWDIIGRNPCDGVTPPKPQRSELHVWSTEDSRRFLGSVKDDVQDLALYTLALTTGMRQGELLGLRWTDVELGKRRVRVGQTFHRRKGIPEFDTPKSARSRRTITLGKLAVDALTRHRDAQTFSRKAAGEYWTDSGLVFTNAVTGAALAPSWVTARFKAAAERAKLPVIRFHDLRHTAATLQLAQGTHPKVVSEMLGHATISLTLDVYSHWVPSLHEAAADAADMALGG